MIGCQPVISDQWQYGRPEDTDSWLGLKSVDESYDGLAGGRQMAVRSQMCRLTDCAIKCRKHLTLDCVERWLFAGMCDEWFGQEWATSGLRVGAKDNVNCIQLNASAMRSQHCQHRRRLTEHWTLWHTLCHRSPNQTPTDVFSTCATTALTPQLTQRAPDSSDRWRAEWVMTLGTRLKTSSLGLTLIKDWANVIISWSMTVTLTMSDPWLNKTIKLINYCLFNIVIIND